MGDEQQIVALESGFVEVLDDDLKGAILELGEMVLDEAIGSGALASIPLLGLVVGVGKTAINVHNRNLFMQTLAFLKAFYSGNIDEVTLRKHREKLDNDPKQREKETGFVLTLINRNIQASRSEMQGNLYRAYLNRAFGWDEFVDLSEAAGSCVISDLELLRDAHNGFVEISDKGNGYRVERLAGLGLIQRSMKRIVPFGNETRTDYFLAVSPFGEQFCRYALGLG